MNNTPTNKYSEIVEQCKQAETIIILNAGLVLAQETLSQQGKESLETIKKQTWRINELLKKGESQNEGKIPETLQSSIERYTGEKFSSGFENDK